MGAARKLEYDYSTQPPIQQKKGKKHKHSKKRLSPSLLILAIASISVGFCLFYLGLQVKSMHLNVEIGELEGELAKLYEENAHLVLELESVQRLPYVEAIAREQLGMVEPDSASLLVMSIPEESLIYPEASWVAEDAEEEESLFVVVADWLNQLLPIGGVEAGRIGR